MSIIKDTLKQLKVTQGDRAGFVNIFFTRKKDINVIMIIESLKSFHCIVQELHFVYGTQSLLLFCILNNMARILVVF